MRGNAKGGFELNFGSYGLKAMEPERVTARQIEAARRAITRQMKRAGRVWIRIFPDLPVSKKPIEVRMGKGKGSPEYWACRVKPGRIMFEIDGVPFGQVDDGLETHTAVEMSMQLDLRKGSQLTGDQIHRHLRSADV